MRLFKAAITAGLLAFTSSAYAQLGGAPCPLDPTSPIPACAVVTEPGSVTQDKAVEQALTTAGGAGLYQGQAQFLNSMTDTLKGGISDAETYLSYFAGWVDYGPNGAALALQIANGISQTDANTLTVYQSLLADFGNEDNTLNGIESCNQMAGQTQSVLFAIQCNTEAVINNSQHLQLLEFAQIAGGINAVVHGGYEFNVDAQAGAHEETAFTQQ